MFASTDRPEAAALQRRAAPELIILDADLRVLSASDGVAWLLEPNAENEGHAQELVRAVRRALSGAPPHDRKVAGDANAVVSLVELCGETVLLRVLSLRGAPQGHFAVLWERVQLRDPITRAAARFNLSPREREVLREVMLGHGTGQIATTLGIAETTVADHIKRIAMKTDSHRRSEIIAKVLGTR